MRFYKFSLAVPLAITLVMSLTVASVYVARISIISAVLNNYLAAQQSELTCLEVNLDANFNIVIGKLCIQTPLATFEINNAVIHWQPTTSLLLPELISVVKINAIRVQGRAEIPLDQKTNQQPFADIPLKTKQVMAAIGPLKTPVAVEVERISYLPYALANSSEPISYLARFSADAKAASLTLTTAEDVAVITIKHSPEPDGFNAELDVDLGQLTSFLAHHGVALAEKLSKEKSKQWSISGKLHSQLTWHKETLSTNNQLHNLSFVSTTGPALSDAFTLAGDLHWQSDLSGNTLLLNFDKQSLARTSKLTVNFNQQRLIALLQAENYPVQVVDLLKDNEFNQLDIMPYGKFTLNFAQAKVFIAQLNLTVNKLMVNKATNFKSNHFKKNSFKASNLKARPAITLSLNDISLSYAAKAIDTKLVDTKPAHAIIDNDKQQGQHVIKFSLQQANFSLAAQLDVAAVQPLTKRPVIITATGLIKQNQDDWQIELASGSQITLSALSLTSATADKADISAAKLTTKLQGAVSIAKSIGIAKDISLNLQLDSELTQLQLADVMHLKRVQLTADISGNRENILVNGQAFADNVALATIKLSGVLAKPKLEVSAKDILVTDLLALNVNLPIDVELIDGQLSYHLVGQLLELSKSMAEPMTHSISNSINSAMKLSISLQEITGEIAGIWLQDLNWQQTLSLEKGQVTSLPQDQNKNQAQGKDPANNLSIAMIEAAVPIENFSAQIQLHFQQQGLALVAKNMGGEVLGGNFNISKAQWPFQGDRSVDVQLNSIDLEKLLELDQQQGIVVTGNISGNLPVYFDGKQWLIKAGELHNVSNGIIQVINNAAVVQLKASSTELKLAFDALQNLHYHQLTSAVSMAGDGYMKLATVIKGRNPDLDNEVNFNLNLHYDLLGLLESLDITQQMEQKIIKQSQQKLPQH